MSLLVCALLFILGAWDRHPVGMPVSTAITFGDAYATPMELYDARISVTEVLRGAQAWELLKKESSANEPPKPGLEYVLARIRFEFTARGKPGDKRYVLKEDQFVAFLSNGSTEYPQAKVVFSDRKLARTLKSGDSSEGYVAFILPRTERKPFMVFCADVHVLSHSGAGPAFRLY